MVDDKAVLEILDETRTSLAGVLDQALEQAMDRLNAAAMGSPEEEKAEAEVKRLNELIAATIRLKLQIADKKITASGLIQHLHSEATKAKAEAEKLKNATAKVSQISAVVDQLTGVVKAFSPFVPI